MTEKKATDLKNMLFTITKDNEDATLHLSKDELTFLIRCITEGMQVAKVYGWYDAQVVQQLIRGKK